MRNQLRLLQPTGHEGDERMRDRKAVGNRLRQALDGCSTYRDVRAFWKAIKGEGVKVTYPTMTRYFSGGITNPPLGFLHKAAKLLGVRSAWLAFGEGCATEAEEARARDVVRQEDLEDESRKILEAFEHAFPAYTRLGALAKAAMMDVWAKMARLFLSILRVRPELSPFGDEVRGLPEGEHLVDFEIKLAEEVGSLFRLPFDQLQLDPVGMPAIDQYVVLQAEAILTLIPDPISGQQGAEQATEKKED